MADYRLKQSGNEVQDILDNAAMRAQLTAETERAQQAEQQLQTNIDSEANARQQADATLQQHIDGEASARQQADATLQQHIDTEQSRAESAEHANADDIDAIEAKIPADASEQNKLATEGFVNSSVATATATYRGSYNLVSDLSLTTAATEQQIANALAGEITGADNNDYCFVQIPAADATPTVIARVDRYKFDGTAWSFEYSLNNSGFTAAQWDAINSAITSGLVTKLSDLPTNAELTALLQGKQAVIADLATIRSGAAAGATAYQKPASGIPETDLTVELQLALASFITATAQNLAYYYLKSETYSASQVDQMLAAIRQFQYEAVQTLPEASVQTVGKIYLVPSADPKTQNTKDEYITLTVTEEGTTTYAWEQIGSTDIDLTNYYTKAQADAAITAALNTALAAYSTTTQVSTMISTAINSALQAYATKEYVASQVQEYAGTFRGTYNTLADLEATTGNHHNDYAWVKVTDTDGDNDYDRYKYNGSAWVFEYRLNNTHFTAAELAAIRSGMTTEKREKLDNLPATASSSIAATTGALTISGAKKFFVGTQGQDGRWTLESLTPAEMQKCAYAYLAGATVGSSPAHLQGTDANGNPQRITPNDLASILGVGGIKDSCFFKTFTAPASGAVKILNTPAISPSTNANTILAIIAHHAGGNSWVDVLVSHSGNLKNSTICGTRNSNVSYINVGTQINITNGASEAANYYVSILVFGGTIA